MSWSIRFRRPPCRAAALALAAAAALAWSADARAYTRTFSAGSLIIPAQAEYQTDCGMTSAYGLVYSILWKNAALMAAGQKPITIYWVIEPKKLSHHRCNTDTDVLPDYSKPNDNDGCDLAIQSAAGQPVALLSTTNGEIAPFTVYTTLYNGAKGDVTRASTSPGTPVGSTKKVVKYSGGLWVIDAADRAAALSLFASDPIVHLWRDGGSCTNIPVSTNGSHHTTVHSARIAFTAPVARMMNVKPNLIALLDAGAVTLLQDYLRNAGLTAIPNAGGTTTTHGVIYDTLTPVTDFVSTPTYPHGALNMLDPADATRTFYQVVWAPHWEADVQSTIPKDGDPGDSIAGDGKWTSQDPLTGTHDDAVTNALKNISFFAEAGNGVFAECASIESLEGSYRQVAGACTSQSQCECTDPALCVFGDIQPLACAPGYTNACGGCYQCPAGHVLDAQSCNEIRCVPTANQCVSATDTWVNCGTTSGCYSCQTGFQLDTTACPGSPAMCTKWNGTKQSVLTPLGGPVNSVPPSAQTLACESPGYARTCVVAPGSIDVPGNDATRFHATNRFDKNGLGNSFSGPDCTDGKLAVGAKYKASISGDCYDFHPDIGGPGNIFAQKGNFNYTGTSGHIHQYQPPASVGSFYYPDVLEFATSWHPTDTSRRGWDFMTARHKDGDPSKGMIVYLAGHSYQNDVAGSRIVLNTLLNLGFSDQGLELARSEPVGYVTRDIDPATGQWIVDAATKQPRVIARTVFQGTYIQRQPPGPFQDWLNYNPASPRAWRFPYIDGHLRAYDLDRISTAKQDFKANALWDAADRMPLPQARRIVTTLKGTGNRGWAPVDVSWVETQPASCVPSGRSDATGQPICALSYELAACGTAGVTQAVLDAGDASGTSRNRLGMFVQQVRGHCSAHNKFSGAPIWTPTDAQCDDLKQQKNRAKLGGVDHSSPAVIGPSRFIGNDGTTGIKWALRPVVAYVGGRDGMLHAIFVSALDASWGAEGRTLPAGITSGTELWAYLPPGQLCGLATNSAMVDAVVNIVDVFGNFPKDANNDGVFDLSNMAERPDGIRRWRTVLIAAAGQGGSEVFALDITNPLKPALLWDISGAREKGGVFDPANPATWSPKLVNPKTGLAAKSSDAQPIVKTALYDYRHLGLTYGSAVGMLRWGNAYRYVVYLATSAADYTASTPLGYKGLEVFAVDVITGEKLWHWQNRYQVARDAAGLEVIADNVVPGRPALVDVDGNGTVDRVYVGDMEGRLWELDAESGKNVNFLRDSGSGQFFALPFFGTPPMTGGTADDATKALFRPAGSTTLAQQPLTSPIGIGRLTTVPCDVYRYLEGRLDVAQGTMGVDWAIAPFEAGNLLVLPSSPENAAVRLKDASCSKLTGELAMVDTRDRDISLAKPLRTRGVLLPAAQWKITLGVGERLFGMPKIVGNDIVLDTSNGSFSGDITETASDAGTTKLVNAANPNGKAIASIGKAFGGALVMDDTIVVTSATGMARVPGAITPPKDGDMKQTTARDRFTPANFGTWEERPPATPAP